MIRLLLALALLSALPAQAHRPSDAFIDLTVDSQGVSGSWQIALRDLVVLTDLDSNRDQQLSWGELRQAQATIAALLGQALQAQAESVDCQATTITDMQLNDRSDGRYAWFAVSIACPQAPQSLGLNYQLLSQIDPTHRGILILRAQDNVQTAVLDPNAGLRRFNLTQSSAWQAFVDYVREGIWHIWIGLDHILFLLALLLPAVLIRQNGQWQPVNKLKTALLQVFGIVTAFTLAHSITLTLAALGLVHLPGALVESLIAASVMLAALNNVFPLVVRARWSVAFVFGLIHGFGFASVLAELGLPQQLHIVALIAFNLGVEVGQLAIVLVAVPLAYSVRHTHFYRYGFRIGGSGIVAVLAGLWLAQRSGLL